MAYTPTNWKTGDIVTADKLNNIENGILGVETDVGTLKSQITEVKEDVFTAETQQGTAIYAQANEFSVTKESGNVYLAKKNLLLNNRPDSGRSSSGVEATLRADGGYDVAGASTAGGNLYFSSLTLYPGTYTISGLHLNPDSSSMVLKVYKSGAINISCNADSSATFTVESTITNVSVYLNFWSANKTFSAVVYPMLNIGVTAQPFEKFSTETSYTTVPVSGSATIEGLDGGTSLLSETLMTVSYLNSGRLSAIDDSVVSENKTWSSIKIGEEIADLPTIVLPSAIYAVEGAEMNIYNDNIFIGDYSKFAINWQINSVYWTDQYEDRFCIKPQSGDAGDYIIKFSLKNKKTFQNVASRDIPLHVFADSTLTSKKVLFIGDSLTNAGYFPYEIQHNLSSDGVESIGTVESKPWFGGSQVSVYAEGRGGWSAHDYVTQASKGDVTNAFWNSGAFDFPNYLTANSFAVPDIIFIGLGTNGVGDAEESVAAISEMIASIRDASETVPIVINLITPAATQDGWTNSSHGGSVDQFTRLQLLLNQAYMDAFDGRETDNIYVAPSYINIDRKHDFPYEETACSSRNPYVVYRQTNNVHLANYGYFKMADVFWAMIQKILG